MWVNVKSGQSKGRENASQVKVMVWSVYVRARSVSFLLTLKRGRLATGNSRVIMISSPLATGCVRRGVICIVNVAHVRLVM